MLVLLGIILGFGLGFLYTRISDVMKYGVVFTVFGYEIAVRRSSEVVEVSEKVMPIKQTKKSECELCEGESEIRIGGVKSKCPKCANNMKTNERKQLANVAGQEGRLR